MKINVDWFICECGYRSTLHGDMVAHTGPHLNIETKEIVPANKHKFRNLKGIEV